MRRFLMIAAAAMIALVGLSANQCSGGKEDKAEPAQTEAPAATPDDSMSDDKGSMSDDKGSMGSDSDNMGSDSNSPPDEAPAQ
jgi:hypothetical protein